ncbi:MAG: RNA polymerase sigma factor [Oscillatoria sp. SIO1A7]|nr:RNA polymerase sigma factor [Oscillatoria sp. SIO1A7]
MPAAYKGQYRDGVATGTKQDDIVAEFWRQWEENRDALYRLCLGMMKNNQANAEDALQEACIKAWEKLHKFAGKIGKLKSWLFELTRNLCIDIIRKRSRVAAVESIDWTSPEETIATAVVETPELVLEKEEKYNEIARAIADLPERLRSTFVLHFYQEQAHTEIAEKQGISYDNVCKRISQARKKLKQNLTAYFRASESEDLNLNNNKTFDRDSISKPAETPISPSRPEEVELEKSDSLESRVESREKIKETVTVSATVEVLEVEESKNVGSLGNLIAFEGLNTLTNFSSQLSVLDRSVIRGMGCKGGGGAIGLILEKWMRGLVEFVQELPYLENYDNSSIASESIDKVYVCVGFDTG